MYYSKTIQVNGVDCSHHRVERLEVSSDGTMLGVFLNSWPNEEARLQGHRPAGPAFVNGIIPPGLRAAVDQVVQGSDLLSNAVPTADAGMTLDLARKKKRADIKAKRQEEEEGGFAVPGVGVFDSDPASQTKIIGASVAAQKALHEGSTFSRTWTTADDGSVLLDAEQMLAVGMALMDHVDAVHQTARTLRVLIDQAETMEQLGAVDWP